jgi:CHAT domain-containing protein
MRLHREGFALRAADVFREGAQQALAENNSRRAILFQTALAGSLQAVYRFNEAIAEYESARTLARRAGLRELAGVIASNLSSIYSLIGEAGRAEAELKAARSELPPNSPYLCAVLAQSARLALRRGRLADGERDIREGLRLVDALNDWPIRANLMNELGDLRLAQGRLEEAEAAFIEAYRIWRLHSPRGLEVSFYNLGRLRMAQERHAEAISLFGHALEARRTAHSGSPAWAVLHRLGLAHARSGNAAAALAHFERAMTTALQWRAGLLPTVQANTAADVSVGEIAAEHADLAASLALRDRRPDLEWRSFLVVERNRATSLRLLATRALLDEPEYAELLNRFRSGAAAGAQDESIGARLAAMERRSASILHQSSISQQAVAASLGAGDALFSFKLGPRRSWLWALSAGRLQVIELPPRDEIRRRVESFRAAINGNAPDLPAQAAALRKMLFGSAAPAALKQPRWLLSLDEELFALPFSALGAQTERGFRWLAEDHDIAVLPAASLLQGPRSKRNPVRFAGFGDAIYNPADSRLAAGDRAKSARLVNASLALPRLAGSGEEVRRAASLWRSLRGPASVRLGEEATAEAVMAAAREGTDVIHIAGHVTAETGSAQGYFLDTAASGGAALRPGEELELRLSLGRDGRASGLRAQDIARMRLPGALIVVSGCSSGRGVVQSAAGLMGLNRAWLAAGARGAVGSLWPVSDDSGEFFEGFYSSLGAGAPAARALRQAQVRMIQSRSWRSQPRHWAAWFLMSRE